MEAIILKFDIFFSICQTPVDGAVPSERQMFLNFFDQLELADELGFGTAWVAETHLSCQIQKGNPGAVVPDFQGEIGLNTDILQVAHKAMARTRRIHLGSAIRNIICNGGPIAHAEAIRTFLTLHGLEENQDRELHIGFASGRFPFSNSAYGITPRNAVEQAVWPILKGRIFQEATEIFLRLMKGETLSSDQITHRGRIRPSDFRNLSDWDRVVQAAGADIDVVETPSFYDFHTVGVIPFEAPLEHLTLTVGTADPVVHDLANQIMPVRVFNLSITPPKDLENLHERMRRIYHKDGGDWQRSYMPRTVLCFINDDPGASIEENRDRAKATAQRAAENYWRAIEGTLDPMKVSKATENALLGTPQDVLEQIQERFHPEDRLMLWFDFNNHDSSDVMRAMKVFMEKVAPNV